LSPAQVTMQLPQCKIYIKEVECHLPIWLPSTTSE
jgi:hypothetical protein